MKLVDIMTITEAAKKWNKVNRNGKKNELNVSTIRYACIKGRFKENEARKSEGTWLITAAGMERLYGPMPPI